MHRFLPPSSLLATAAPPELSTATLEDAWARATERLADFATLIPGLLIGIPVILLSIALSRWVASWERPYRGLTSNAFLQDFARQGVAIVVLLVGVLIALDVMQATAIVAALLGTAGLAGLAVGFAFKDLIENYIAGVMLSVRQPFSPNDLVVIDGEQGRVVRLTMRATILMTLDGNHLRLPNARVFKATILNYTRNPRRRFDIGVGVGVDTDLLEAQELGIEVLSQIEGVLADPGPSAGVEDLAESSVLVRFYAWVDQRTHSFWGVKSEAIRLVKQSLEDAGIDMPEPIYRLKMLDPNIGGDAEAPTPRERTVRASQSLTAQDDLESAVEEELASAEANLLNPDAPRE